MAYNRRPFILNYLFLTLTVCLVNDSYDGRGVHDLAFK